MRGRRPALRWLAGGGKTHGRLVFRRPGGAGGGLWRQPKMLFSQVPKPPSHVTPSPRPLAEAPVRSDCTTAGAVPETPARAAKRPLPGAPVAMRAGGRPSGAVCGPNRGRWPLERSFFGGERRDQARSSLGRGGGRGAKRSGLRPDGPLRESGRRRGLRRDPALRMLWKAPAACRTSKDVRSGSLVAPLCGLPAPPGRSAGRRFGTLPTACRASDDLPGR